MPELLTLDICALGLSVTLSLSLVMIVGGAGIRRRLNRDFAVFALMETAWAVTSLVLRVSLWFRVGDAPVFLETATLSFALMGPFLLLFVARYLKIEGRWPAIAASAVVVASAALSIPLFRGSLVSGPRLISNGSTLFDISPWGIAASAIPAACMLASLALFVFRRRLVKEPFLAGSVAVLFAGFLVGGMFQVNVPIMSFTSTASVGILGWGIVRLQLFNPLRELASDLRERAHTLELIAQVGRKTTAILALDELLRQAVALIRDAFEYFSVGILLIEGDELVLRASSLPAVQALSTKFRLKVGGQGICGWVAASGAPLLVPDVSRDPRYVRCAAEVSTRTELAVPIRRGERVIGVLDIQSARLGALTDNDMATQQTVADQLSSPIENARLFEEAQRRAERLATVNRISAASSAVRDLPQLMETVHREVTPIFDADAFFIALLDAERDELDFRIQVDEGTREQPNREPVGEGLTSRVIRTRRPLLVNDFTGLDGSIPKPEAWGTGKMPSSWIGVPMCIGERLVGVLSVQTYRPRRYDAQDLLLAATIADQVAVAVENARLYEELRQELEERQRTETVLRESEEKFRNLAEQSPNMIFIWSAGRVVYANRQCELLMGYAREEFYGPGFNFMDITAPKYRGTVAANFRRHSRGEDVEPYEYAVVTKSGRAIDVISTTKLIQFGGTSAILGIITDISNRIRSERLLQSLNAAALAMEQALVPAEIFPPAVRELARLGLCSAVFLADPAAGTLSLQSHAGRAGEVLLSPTGTADAAPGFDASALPAFAEALDRQQAVLVSLDVQRMREIPALRELASQCPCEPGEPHCAILAPLSVGDEVFGLLLACGEDLAEGDVELFTAFAHQMAAAWRKTTLMQDLEESLAQLRRAQEQLLHAQKMEAIGRLAGGIAHDFNNLLTVISGYANLLLDSVGGNEAALSDLGEIKNAIKRASALTSRLLAFSRKQILQPAVLDLNRVLAGSVNLLRPLIGEDIELVVRLAPAPAAVRADPYQIDQVIINLAVNARDAMPGGGKLLLETALVEADAASVPAGLPTGPYVVLRVQDNGVGMSEETLTHIFEPFFTTKEDGRGTGLGLSTVYGIVTQTGGRIEVQSALGRGSDFTAWFPRVQSTEEHSAFEEQPAPSPGGSGTVLLVEDDGVVRELARRVLEKSGYSVLCASTAREALLAAEGSAVLDLVITDVVMPGGMNGVQMGERLSRSRPDLKVLYMSGYTDDPTIHFGVAGSTLPFIGKPFQPAELLRRVGEMLARPRREGRLAPP